MTRAGLKELSRAIQDVEALFAGPAEADDKQFPLAVDVDHLVATIIGGITRSGLGTASINAGVKQTDAILKVHGSLVTDDQRAVLKTLRELLGRL